MNSISKKKLLKLHYISTQYSVGSMYKGIFSVEMIVSLMNRDIMGYFGSGGLSINEIETSIESLNAASNGKHSFGVNILCNNDGSGERYV